MKKIGYVVLLAVAFSSCVPDTICRLEMNVRMKVTMAGDSISQRGQTTKFTSWDSISVVPIDYDSVIYDNSHNVSALFLPLHDDIEQTQFLMTYRNKIDTLSVTHTNTLSYMDLACGCIYYHTIDSVSYSKNWIDSVIIVNDRIERLPDENLKIIIHGNK